MEFQESQKYLEDLSKVLKEIRKENEVFLRTPIIMSIAMIIFITTAASTSSLFKGIEGILFSGCMFCSILLGAFLGKKLTLIHIVKLLDEVEEGKDEKKI